MHKTIIHFFDVLRDWIVSIINDNFEKCTMKIYTPKTQWKDRGRSIKNIVTIQQQDMSSWLF